MTARRAISRIFCARNALCLVCSTGAFAQPTPADAVAQHVRATLSIPSGASQFHQGEFIEIQLAFTSDQAGFTVSSKSASRWNDDPREEFHLTPLKGAVDPLEPYAHFLGDVRRFGTGSFIEASAPVPTTVTLPLTDWLRFDQPGHYKLSVRTSRVTFRTAAPRDPGVLVTLDTNPIEFNVIPADPQWQATELRDVASKTPLDWSRLRALGTADAVRLMADRYRPDLNPLDQDAILGLLGSVHRQAGVAEMSRLLADPDFAVAPSFLDALALLELNPQEASWPAIRARVSSLREQLLQTLPTKRGEALATSRQTYIAGIEQLAAVKLSAGVLTQLQEVFEQLPSLDQNLWLDQRWTQVSDLSWLPLLRRLASRDVDYHSAIRPELSPTNAVSGLALKRWYELDPKSGRSAILQELVSPEPRFDAEVLGILPDKTLPAQQHQIAQHFVSLPKPSDGPDFINSRPHQRDPFARRRYDSAETHLTSLLFRYGDRGIVPELLPVFKDRLAEGNCFAETNELAFLMKVDPAQADPLLHAAANDSSAQSGCAIVIFQQMTHLFASPVFERFAIDTLDNRDLILATEALRYLRDRGSAHAEQPIYQRLVRWNTKWRDHALDLVFSGTPGPNDTERSFGMELAQALVRGKGWLADEARIRQILALTLEPNAQGDVTAALDQINTKPVQIAFMGRVGSMFLVAQYQLDSVEELQNKLSQYPPRTAFVWSDHRSPAYDIIDRKVSNQISQWSSVSGIRIDGL